MAARAGCDLQSATSYRAVGSGAHIVHEHGWEAWQLLLCCDRSCSTCQGIQINDGLCLAKDVAVAQAESLSLALSSLRFRLQRLQPTPPRLWMLARATSLPRCHPPLQGARELHAAALSAAAAQIYKGRVYDFWNMFVWLQQVEGLRAFDRLFGPLGVGPLPDEADFVCCAQFVVDRNTIRRSACCAGDLAGSAAADRAGMCMAGVHGQGSCTLGSALAS